MVLATDHPRSRARRWNAAGSPEGANTTGSLQAEVCTPVIRGTEVDDDCEYLKKSMLPEGVYSFHSWPQWNNHGVSHPYNAGTSTSVLHRPGRHRTSCLKGVISRSVSGVLIGRDTSFLSSGNLDLGLLVSLHEPCVTTLGQQKLDLDDQPLARVGYTRRYLKWGGAPPQ